MPILDAQLVGEESQALPPAQPGARVLVLGVGNLLMGDEGVGIHAIRRLETAGGVAGARILDGGTGGVTLLEDVQAAGRVIIVDATRDGKPAGTVAVLRPRTAKAIPHGLSSHDFGLKDLLAAATLLGEMPEVCLVTVSVEEVRPMSLELSEPVARALPEVVEAVRRLAA